MLVFLHLAKGVMMINFIEAVRNVMEEQGKEVERLFSSGIISKNTFWKYKQRNPSLQTLIKVANYLEVSIDYLFVVVYMKH